MDTQPPYDITDGVTAGIARYALDGLKHNGVAYLSFRERGYEPRRIVIAALPESEELMIAMEGSGCAIINRHREQNEFTLVTAGFFLMAARRLSDLLRALAVEVGPPVSYPQLAHYPE